VLRKTSTMCRRVEEDGFQLARALVVGGVAFLIDILILWILTRFFRVHYLISAVCGFSVGVIVNYLMSINWVFTDRSLNSKGIEFTLFSLIGIVGLILNAILMWLLTEKFSVYYLFSRIASGLVIFLVNFLARKILLFSK